MFDLSRVDRLTILTANRGEVWGRWQESPSSSLVVRKALVFPFTMT